MIYLRKAKEKDIDVIRELAFEIWPSTYSKYLTQGQITYMLDKMYNKGELLQQLSSGHTFLIAEELKKDIGFAGFSLVDEENRIYKLHKLYVLPETQGKGIGKLLINEVYDIVKKAKGTALQVNVNRNNNAKDFYERAGFKIKETVDLDIGNGFFMNDYVMELPINS